MKVLLLVEDHPLVARTTTRFLEAHGFTVRWARTVSEARMLLEQGRFDAALLDRIVGDELGWDLRHECTGATVVLMAGDAPPDSPPYFTKGHDPTLLLRMFDGEEK